MAEKPSSNIEQLRLTKISINNIDLLKEHVISIDIFESLSHPGITGRIELMDYQAINEYGNIIAGDDMVISFTVYGKENKAIETKFKIYANEGSRVLPGQMYNTVVYSFCSAWLIPGLSKKVSKNYKNKYIHEIVKDLLEECDANIGYIEPTKQKLENFVTPLWSPCHSIKHLLSVALNTSDLGGYLIWTDLRTDKVNVTTIDYLTKGNLGKFKEFMLYPANQRYEGKINALSFESSFDVIRLLNAGIKHQHISFDYDTGKHVVYEDDHEKLKNKHLAKKFPLPKSYLQDKHYTFPKFSAFYPQTDARIQDKSKLSDLLSGRASNEHIFLSCDTIKINIVAPGEPERRVGWLAEVNFPSQNINAGDTTGFKQLKGDYLIADIRHTFSFVIEYTQAISLVADGYKEHSRDLISW